MPEDRSAVGTQTKVLLSRKEVADLLSLSVRSVDTLLQNGELPSVRVGRRRLVRAATVQHFSLRDHKTKGPTKS